MFSNNIIFMDGEFTGLYTNGTDFLSIGLIRPTGEELYLELKQTGAINEWTLSNVLPFLQNQKVTQEEAVKAIREFVGDGKPYLVADVNQFDWMGICGLFGIYNVPFHYIPIDFASILWSKGIDPDSDRVELARSRGINVESFKKHNALDDARVLKKLYDTF